MLFPPEPMNRYIRKRKKGVTNTIYSFLLLMPIYEINMYLFHRWMQPYNISKIKRADKVNRNSTDFACLITGFLTDYLLLQRCYSSNTLLSYRDTLKLFLWFLGEAKGISSDSFYEKDFKRELVIEFLEWYCQKGAGISAANQRLAAIKAFAGYVRFESIECIASLPEVAGIKVKKHRPGKFHF